MSLAFTAVVLPAKAADPGLINLVMPDASVIAGVNVDQAKNSPFGQYVLSQIPANNTDLQKLVTLTGFDPTRDVHELLAASTGTQNTGLVAARGAFDPSKIASVAVADGAKTETYGGITILEAPNQSHAIAFLDSTLVVAGDLASVKAAIDRQKAPTPLPSTVLSQITQWSTSQDAWAISTVPPSQLHPANPPSLPGTNGINPQAMLQTVQSAGGGVKFGNNVVISAQLTSDNAADATQLQGALQLLVSLAQMQAANDPKAAALAQSLKITTSGQAVNVSLSLTEDQIQSITKPSANVKGGRKVERPIRQM